MNAVIDGNICVFKRLAKREENNRRPCYSIGSKAVCAKSGVFFVRASSAFA